jgi:hypothetical protein
LTSGQKSGRAHRCRYAELIDATGQECRRHGGTAEIGGAHEKDQDLASVAKPDILGTRVAAWEPADIGLLLDPWRHGRHR